VPLQLAAVDFVIVVASSLAGMLTELGQHGCMLQNMGCSSRSSPIADRVLVWVGRMP
jgi:hypothetical protein